MEKKKILNESKLIDMNWCRKDKAHSEELLKEEVGQWVYICKAVI